jgi:hypothetical protein
MPTYNFKNNETGEVTEHFMKFLKWNSLKKIILICHQVLGASGLVRGTGDIKTDSGFKEVLTRLQKHIQHQHLRLNLVGVVKRS